MKPFLLITGMHRSGTSFLARALNLRGTYLGSPEDLVSDDFRSLRDNLRGHWESSLFVKLADQTLQKNGGAWDEIPKKVVIDDNIGNEIKKYSNTLVEHPSFTAGFKDPRIIFCLESWEKFLPTNLVVVGIYRHPLKVAESLKQRNGFTYDKSINLWKQYNQKLLSLLEKYQGFLLNFDWPKEKLFSEIDLISEKLGLSKKISLDEWHTNDLKRSDILYNKTHSLNDSIISILSKLDERSEQNSKITINSVSRTVENLYEIIEGNLLELRNQHNYFIKIHTANSKTIESQSKTIEFQSKTIDNIHRSLTWRALAKIDSIRKKFRKL